MREDLVSKKVLRRDAIIATSFTFVLISILSIAIFLYASSLIRTFFSQRSIEDFTVLVEPMFLHHTLTVTNDLYDASSQMALQALLFDLSRSTPNVKGVNIASVDGRILQSDFLPVGGFDEIEHIRRAAETNEVFYLKVEDEDRLEQFGGGGALYEIYQPMVLSSGDTVIINIYFDASHFESILRDIMMRILLLTALTTIVSGGVITLAFRRVIGQVGVQERKIEQYARGLESMVETRTKDLKKSERSLKKGLEELQTQAESLNEKAEIIEHSQEGIIVTDQKGIIRYVNVFWQEMSGWSAREVIGKKTPAIVKSGRQSEDVYTAMWKTILEGKPFRGTFINKTRKGEEYIVDQIIAPIKNIHGDVTGFFGLQRDVTAQVQAEEKVHVLNELKSRFITTLTHVTRTPLSEIRWNLEGLLDEQVGIKNKEQLAVVRRSLMRTSEITHLISNLSFVLDVERGTTVYEKQKASFSSLARSSMEEKLDICQVKDLTCRMRVGKTEPGVVLMDTEKIRLVMSSMIDNATRYSKEKGAVSLSVTKVKAGAKFMVKDEGLGIPKEEQIYVFDRFYRASNATTVYPDGAGISLYLAKKIIEAHGGTIGFTSVERKGTTFWFILPA